MPYNPSPQVALARDAARKLGAERAVIVYVLPDGRFGYASYGETAKLCSSARKLADCLYDAAERFLVEEE